MNNGVLQTVHDVRALAQQAVAAQEQLKQQLQAFHKNDVDVLVTQYGVRTSLSLFRKIPVAALRHLAKEYTEIGFDGETLSRTNKATLLITLTEYYERENRRSM